MASDAYSLVTCLDTTQADNQAPRAGMLADGIGLAFGFSVDAEDEDGGIVSYEWHFGDGQISSDQSPEHTYEAPGWYLVSCTVTDDDGVSATDWHYVQARLPGDADVDGDVDAFDYMSLKGSSGTAAGAVWQRGDFDGDGDVDLRDYVLLRSNFGYPRSAQPVPEPVGLGLLAAGALPLLRRRAARRR